MAVGRRKTGKMLLPAETWLKTLAEKQNQGRLSCLTHNACRTFMMRINYGLCSCYMKGKGDMGIGAPATA